MAGLSYSGNGVGDINEVKLHRGRLVLGLVTTFGGFTFRYFAGHSAWPSRHVLYITNISRKTRWNLLPCPVSFARLPLGYTSLSKWMTTFAATPTWITFNRLHSAVKHIYTVQGEKK